MKHTKWQIIKIIFRIFIFLLLTLFTEIGGIIYLISISTYRIINNHSKNKFFNVLFKFISFLVFYCLISFLIVPIIAKPFGRVPLPWTAKNSIQPLNIITCLLNRNYVTPDLEKTLYDVSKQMNSEYPGTTINYLDANFPFYSYIPMFPHLGHNDGKKLDLSFCYIDRKTGKQTNECPAFFGYGICEEPLPGEENTSEICSKKGYWRYGLFKIITPQSNKKNYSLDNERTSELVNLFASQPLIGKIFIEPHLKTRLNLTSEKIRFHGCQAVRHDDHIHIQLK